MLTLDGTPKLYNVKGNKFNLDNIKIDYDQNFQKKRINNIKKG